MQANTPTPERRRDAGREPDRRRASQGNDRGTPSPVIAQGQPTQYRAPPALMAVGNASYNNAPASAAAQINVPVGTPQRANHHPYASPNSYEYSREGVNDSFLGHQQYGRVSPMVSSVNAAPPALSAVRARGGDVGVSQTAGYHNQTEEPPQKSSLLKILTCRCG